jgi:PAS domain S-box-containing protein
MNKAGLKITGATADQIIGKTHRESGLYNSEQCDYWESKIKYVFESEKTWQEQFSWQSSKGLIWLDWRLAPEYDDNDNIVSVLGVSRDITLLKKAEHDIHEREKTLNETEEIFNNFLLNSPYYVFFKDSEIRTLRLSKNYEKMLGKKLNELIGKTMDDLFPSEFAKNMIEDDKRILQSGKPETLEEELNGKCYTTMKFPIILDGIPKYLAGYTIDITDQKKNEKALREKANELERFNNLMTGRELRMIELKKEINELLIKHGGKEKYKIYE